MKPKSAVYDCNILLGAILSTRGANYACMRLVNDGSVDLVLSSVVLDELRRTPYHRDLQRFKQLTPDRVEAFVSDMRQKARIVNVVPVQFEYQRDPNDAHYINLALAAGAVYVVSRDNDLGDLMNPNKPEAIEFQRRFPSLRIMEPRAFLAEIRKSTIAE